MSTDNLPAWPEDPVGEDHPDYESGMYSREYWRLESYAYRARMEALKKYAQHEDGCRSFNPTEDHGHWDLSCNCGLDALLAACERRSEG